MLADESPNIDWATRLFPPRTHVALALAARSSACIRFGRGYFLLGKTAADTAAQCLVPQPPSASDSSDCSRFTPLVSVPSLPALFLPHLLNKKTSFNAYKKNELSTRRVHSFRGAYSVLPNAVPPVARFIRVSVWTRS